jgi:hypothetical protein
MKPMKALIVLFLLSAGFSISAQNLIGYHEKEIRQYMKDKQKEMIFQNFTNNSTFKYLKYADKDETRTLLFFLSADSVCKSERFVCDKSLETQMKKEFDSIYTKSGDNVWTETKNEKKYIIELKDEEWSFNITIRLNE